MKLEDALKERSGNQCEVCGSAESLSVYMVPPYENDYADRHALLCQVCKEQIEDETKTDANHWRCLNDSMWSEVSAVKVIAYRMLNRLKSEGWPQDLLDMIYLTEEEMNWAKSFGDGIDEEDRVIHLDSNGAQLANGDTVTLIKDLNVKGANFVAKRGTPVRNITLVHDNAEQIEGKVEGQKIVILTQYVKKQ
ncbi:MAG: PhnA domain-containing protein [Flavobacteriales bacterium]|nr:PhnA domain-containing protein [Flavobacteriales bacterium]